MTNILLTQEEFESLTTTEQPFYCQQKDCAEKEKKLKQTRAKEEAAEKRRQKQEDKKAKAQQEKVEKGDKYKKKKDGVTVTENEVDAP